MNNSLQIDNKLLSCRVVYHPLEGEKREGVVRACYINDGDLIFLIELDNGRFEQKMAVSCKRIYP